MDNQALLFDPIYAVYGVAATLTTVDGSTLSLTVIDKTAGVSVADITRLETIKPACTVRAAELVSLGVERARLTDGKIEFNGKAWRIKASQPKPTNKGELDGEYLLILQNEG